MFQDPGQSGETRSKQGRKDVDSQAQEEIHYMERHRGHTMEQLEVRKNHSTADRGVSLLFEVASQNQYLHGICMHVHVCSFCRTSLYLSLG